MFEPSPHKGPAIINSLGQRIDEERLLRTDQKIELKKPEDLKAGQVYRLVVTSDDLDLTASFVKEEPKNVSSTSTTTDADQLEKDRQELFELIRGPLLMGLGANLMVFTARISTMKTRTPFNITPNSNMNGLNQIQGEINKINEKVLSDLMKAVRLQMPMWKNESNLIAKNILEKKILGMCFKAITPTGLENMMRTHLKAVTQNQCSEEFDPIIEEVSKKFRDSCMRNVTVTP